MALLLHWLVRALFMRLLSLHVKIRIMLSCGCSPPLFGRFVFIFLQLLLVSRVTLILLRICLDIWIISSVVLALTILRLHVAVVHLVSLIELASAGRPLSPLTSLLA